jgi:hypothetical protein
MVERRKLQRFSLCIPTRIVTNSGSNKREVLELITVNICAGGAYFKTKYEFSFGSKVHMDLVLPINKSSKILGMDGFVEINGKVIRADSEGIAVLFDPDYEILPFRNI